METKLLKSSSIRKLNTTEGTIELNKPQIREFPFENRVFDPYSRVEKALDSVMLESYLNGVSTHNMMNVVKSLGMGNVSASYVSLLASGLDANVKLFLERNHIIPYEIHIHRCNILQGKGGWKLQE